MAMPFEPKLSASLRMLPIQPSDPWSSSEHRMRSLAYRTLVRSWRHQLPSGQAIAQALGETPVLSRSRGEDPLWVYVLREAEEQQSGERLGPVGARIVAEVVLGLLAGDPEWHAHSLSAWSPGIMACLRHGRPLEQRKELSLVNEIMAEQKSYGMIDFLRDARMPITQADWERRHDGLLR
jgi:hypothetical protein